MQAKASVSLWVGLVIYQKLVLGPPICKFRITITPSFVGSEQLYNEATSLCANLTERQTLIHDLESRLPSELTNVERMSEQAACKLSMDYLQKRIELAYFHMKKKHQSIQDVAGIILFFGAHVYAWYSDFLIHVVSSKQRSSLRRSSATDRKKISKLVTQYQILSRQIGEEPPLEKDVLEGNFPWSALTGMYEHVSAIHCVACVNAVLTVICMHPL